MGGADGRYSEKRLSDSFDVHVLFTESLQFRMADVLAALDADYPGFGPLDVIEVQEVHDTGGVTLIAASNRAAPDGERQVTIISNPGSLGASNHYDTAIERARAFPGARYAYNAHRSALTISVGSDGTDLAARFRAARLATAISAVFAGDETCCAILFPSGDVIASPEDWREGASKAMQGEWPLFQWTSLQPSFFQNENGPDPLVACGAIGMAAFNGHEVSFPAAPVLPAFAGRHLLCAMHLLLQCGHEFADGNTMSEENSDLRLRIRHLREGEQAQTDTWVLLHPDSIVDEMEAFGPRGGVKPPPGYDNRIMGDERFMRTLLGETRQ